MEKETHFQWFEELPAEVQQKVLNIYRRADIMEHEQDLGDHWFRYLDKQYGLVTKSVNYKERSVDMEVLDPKATAEAIIYDFPPIYPEQILKIAELLLRDEITPEQFIFSIEEIHTDSLFEMYEGFFNEHDLILDMGREHLFSSEGKAFSINEGCDCVLCQISKALFD